MSTYMHCRPCCATDVLDCSPLFTCFRSDYMTTSNYHDTQNSPTNQHYDHRISQQAAARRRRQLDDQITTYASNYYSTLPCQMSHSPQPSITSPTLRTSALPSPSPHPTPNLLSRSMFQPQLNHNNIYCDLFNLLEHPTPTSITKSARQRRKYSCHDHNTRNYPCPSDHESGSMKGKHMYDKKRHCQKSSYSKEKRLYGDKFVSVDQSNRPIEKERKISAHQRRAPQKGFFRRVVSNYLCVPSTIGSSGYSS